MLMIWIEPAAGMDSLRVVSRLFARIFSSISETELPFAFKENPEK
jgi:hypothetical protein